MNGASVPISSPIDVLALASPPYGAFDWAFTLEGIAVPGPGAIALLGLAGLRGSRRR